MLKALHTMINDKPDLKLYKHFIKVFRLTDSINVDATYKSLRDSYRQARTVRVRAFKDHALFTSLSSDIMGKRGSTGLLLLMPDSTSIWHAFSDLVAHYSCCSDHNRCSVHVV